MDSRTGNVDSKSEKLPQQITQPSSKEKRKCTGNSVPESEKKMKIEKNSLCRNLDGGAVLSLQPASEPTSSGLSTSSKTSEPKPTVKTRPLKFIPYVYEDPKKSKPREPSATFKNTNPATLKSPLIIKEQEPNIQMAESRAVFPVKTPTQTQSETTTRLSKTIQDTSTFTQRIHHLQVMMKRMSDSNKSYKQIALKLYLRFPCEYNKLHELLDAPPKLKLKSVFDDSFISYDKCSLFSIYLTKKAQTMTTEQKQCFISMGELKIKRKLYYDIKKDYLLGIYDHDDVLKPEPATKAVVLILQGIFENWKQPIGVSYLKTSTSIIKAWVTKNINYLSKIGFNIRAVVSHKSCKYLNMDSYNFNRKIFCLSDISSFFTSFYYMFTKFDYLFNSVIAKIQYVKYYVELDSNKEIPITPKLSVKLLNPTSIDEVNIKSVMEVFSMTTAAAISAYIDFNLIDKSAKHTVELIIKIRKLYDILSAGSWGDESQNWFGEQSHVSFVYDMLAMFDSLELVESTNDLSSEIKKSYAKEVAMFKTQIKLTLSMSEYLKLQQYKSLPVGRFTTDAIALFFDQVRNHSKSITKPTAKDVNSIFRQTALIHLLKKHATHGKFTPMEDVLTEFTSITSDFKEVSGDSTAINDPSSTYKINSSDYATFDVGRKDGVIFLAGFLLKKCTDVHKNECKDVNNYLQNTSCDVETLTMSESIMDDVQKNICLPPSAYFIEFVESMEILFRTFMNREILCKGNKKILDKLLKSTEPIDKIAGQPCLCFPVNYLKRLYLRYRMYHMLKYNNELIKTKLHSRLVVNKL